MMDDTPNDAGFDRRTYLAALATTTAAGLAGCNGGGSGNDNSSTPSSGNGGGSSSSSSGGGGNQLGERVPNLTGISLGGVAGASSIEQANTEIAKKMNDVLGVHAKVTTKELTTFWQEAYSDSRSFNFHVDIFPPFPSNLDPQNVLGNFVIPYAGANGKPNTINYANCDYTTAVQAQQTASNRDARVKAVNQATSTASKDVVPITLSTSTNAGAYRTDQLKPADLGTAGATTRNPQFLWNTVPTGNAKGIIMNTAPGNINNAAYMTARPAPPWVCVVYMPLLIRDKNYKLQPGLATDYKVSNGYKTFTFDLHPEATFHNGDPVTSADVKWTLEFMNEHGSAYPGVPTYPYDTIKAVDKHTVEVNMKSPQPSWVTAFVPVWSGV